MKGRVMIFILLLFSLRTVSAQGEQVKGRNQAQSQIDALVTKLADNEIGRLEILNIPPRILTRTRITPEMLEKDFYYKLTIRDIRGNIHENKLVL